MIVVNFRIVLSLILIKCELLRHTLAFQDDQVLVQDSLKAHSGYFDLNKLPQQEMEHESVNSNQVFKHIGLETSGHQSSASRDVNLPQDVIISRPHLSHDVQTQDTPRTSNFRIRDKSVISSSQPRESDLQSAIKEIRIKLINLLRFTPENDMETILHSSVKDLLDPQYLLGFQMSVKDNLVGLERVSDDKVEYDMKVKIRNFQTLTPIAIPAAVSLFYANRLLQKMGEYLMYDEAYRSGAWIKLWNTSTILPFVYFIISCNPSYYMWERIENIAVSAFKAYDELYVLKNSAYDKEDLTRFLLWNTELMHYAARSSDLIESPTETYQPRYLSRTKASPISRILAALLRKPEYEQYTSSKLRVSRREHLTRYIQRCWKSDLEKGYPRKRDGSDSKNSLWDDWMSKSEEIGKTSQKIYWSSMRNDLIGRGNNSPILLVRTAAELSPISKESESNRLFSHHSEEFKEMLDNIQNPIRPKLRLMKRDQDIFHGLSYFLKKHSKRNFRTEANTSENSLDLLSEFLEQDPQSARFVTFWSEFNIYKNDLVYRRNARSKGEASRNADNPNKKRRVSREKNL
ncbi:uncharacterized protein MELLADRAFT_70070 [Melampsora larici-populina 98AG31]|uniref:Secreted protein n=1 Tax=Melampsora larici-populina (strain 98AG31 / pathotype 3-4-7) TaxID=747676 RepID=F4SDG3_MELLP|nr:uncharacterized protein MELLADRAFT_70070 [Melampsora larici-populina 98AG31]EGF97314.1 hypothetical protein MELLADRAFT_70070 [Melampsora larici-populina 98AG31]